MLKVNNRELIKNELLNYIENDINEYNSEKILKEAIKYNLIGSGKYFRSVLLLLLLFKNEEYKDYFDIATAIEMIHTYSLIHDDLPAMDDDDYRRGKLTTHKKYGEDIAILVGDTLLTHAFEKITNNEKIDASKKIELIKLLVAAAGINEGMINGQLLDIQNNNNNITEEELINLHLQKTGKMIALPFKMYGIIKDKSKDEVKALENLGLEIGLLFQIIDDYLDAYSSFEKIGKPIGSDVQMQKDTFVNFYQKEDLEHLITQKRDKINEQLKKHNINDETIEFTNKILKW